MDPASESLDQTLAGILDGFEKHHRLDHSHDQIRQILRQILSRRGHGEAQVRLLEVNLFGSLSGWMEFILDERVAGRDAVPDFARHLRRAFLSHCRQRQIEPDTAVRMAIELATSIMDLALSFRKHLHLPADAQAHDAAPPGLP